MCKMMNSTEETCKLANAVESLDSRVTKVEERMDKIDGSLSVGFAQVNTSIQQLATDFGQRMNTIDLRIVEEKVKWGDTLRKIVIWSVVTILSGAAVAMGVTIWRNFSVK